MNIKNTENKFIHNIFPKTNKNIISEEKQKQWNINAIITIKLTQIQSNK